MSISLIILSPLVVQSYVVSRWLKNFRFHWYTITEFSSIVTSAKTYKKNTANEKIAIDIAERLQDTTVAGHGVFIDYSQTPEVEKHIIAYLVEGFRWTLEKPYFIRKPKS